MDVSLLERDVTETALIGDGGNQFKKPAMARNTLLRRNRKHKEFIMSK